MDQWMTREIIYQKWNICFVSQVFVGKAGPPNSAIYGTNKWLQSGAPVYDN